MKSTIYLSGHPPARLMTLLILLPLLQCLDFCTAGAQLLPAFRRACFGSLPVNFSGKASQN